jgi:hypothetical protein
MEPRRYSWRPSLRREEFSNALRSRGTWYGGSHHVHRAGSSRFSRRRCCPVVDGRPSSLRQERRLARRREGMEARLERWAWMGSPPGMAARSAAVGTSLGLAPQTRLVRTPNQSTMGSKASSRARREPLLGRPVLELGEGQEPGLRAAGLREFGSCSPSKMRLLFSNASSSGNRAKFTDIHRASSRVSG